MIEKRIGIVALAAAMLFCTRPASTQTNHLVVGVDEAPACKDPNALLKLTSEKDKSAFDSALEAAVQSGECTVLRRDQDVTVTGYSRVARLTRVLPKGVSGQYWTSERTLASPAQ